MKYIVDRIEGSYAICEAEDRTMVNIPLSDLPSKPKEGDHIKEVDGLYSIIPDDTEMMKRIKSMMDTFWICNLIFNRFVEFGRCFYAVS